MQLSKAAEADFEAIDIYSVEQFGDDVADAYMRGFRELFELLRAHPLAGEAKPHLGKGLRQLIHRQHRVFYVIDGEVVQIIRVLHHAMDAKRMLKEASR